MISSGPTRRSRPAMPTSSPSACRSSPIPTCRHGLPATPSSIRPIPRPSMAAELSAISIIRRSPPERPTPTRCGQGPARIPVVIRPLVWLKCLRPAPSVSHLRSRPCDQRDSGLHRRSSDLTIAPDKLIGRRRRRVRFNEQVYRVMSFIHCLFTGLRATSWSVLIRDIAAIVLVLLTPHVVNGVYEFLQYGLTLNGYINGVYFVSPFVASAMVLVLHYRLYRAGWLSIRGERCARPDRRSRRGAGAPLFSRPDRAISSQGQHEGDQLFLFFLAQIEPQHQIEEFHRVIEREQAPVVEVGRRVLDAVLVVVLDRPVAVDELIANGLVLEKALQLEVMHLVIQLGGRGMAFRAARLAKE